MSIPITFSNFILFSLFGAPQGSILCSLFSLIYIKNLSNQIVSTLKQLAADDKLSIQHTTLNQMSIIMQIFLNIYHFPSTTTDNNLFHQP